MRTFLILFFFLCPFVGQSQSCNFYAWMVQNATYNSSMNEWSWGSWEFRSEHKNRFYFYSDELRIELRGGFKGSLKNIRFSNAIDDVKYYNGDLYQNYAKIGTFRIGIRKYNYTDLASCNKGSASIVFWLYHSGNKYAFEASVLKFRK